MKTYKNRNNKMEGPVLEITVDWVSELENRVIEFTQREQWRETRQEMEFQGSAG